MGINPVTARAVFLDRDGVINHNWFNPETGEWESPIAADQFRLCAGVLETLRHLGESGHLLFLLSNQPSAAKGKCTLEDLKQVHGALRRELDAADIRFQDFFYAYGHPQAVVPALRDTRGRKPDPFFIEKAVALHGLDRARSWMVGDRDTDTECGQRAGLRTIQVKGSEPDGKQGRVTADFHAEDLRDAARIIMAD